MAIGAGSDIAIESADIVLVRNELSDAVTAVELSRKTLRIIKQNLFWAFFYNAIAIPLAAGAFYMPFGIRLTPMIGALAMSCSSIFVVLNALRLRAFKPLETVRASAEEEPLEVLVGQNLQSGRGRAEEENKAVQSSGRDGREYPGEDVMEQTTILKVEGMMCAHCTGRVEKALKALPGVADASADLEEKQVTIKSDGTVSREQFVRAVTDAGYEVIG